MKTINNRKSLLGLNDTHFEELIRLDKFPIKMGVTESPEEQDIFTDMVFLIEKETGMVQLEELISQDVLYEDAHYNNVAASWKDHHKTFAGWISRFGVKNIFEIGGGTGLLAQYYLEIDQAAQWTILEAAPNPVEGCKARYIRGIFDGSYHIPTGYDAVVHSHTMEHFYAPLERIKNISDAMPLGSYMFFSIPNLEEMFKRRYTNVLNFEHTYLCVEPYVTVILERCGYRIIERALFKDEHSVFYVAQKTMESMGGSQGGYTENKEMILAWEAHHKSLVESINETIDKTEKKQEVYLFGAHVYAQYLLAFGLKGERIAAVLDNDAMKQGKRLYGTPYIVNSPKTLEGKSAPIVILHAGTHDDEIKEGILKINNTVKFI